MVREGPIRQIGEEVEVEVAAAEQRHHGAPGDVDATGQQRRRGERTGRFDHLLHAGHHESHRINDLGLVDGHDLVDEHPHDRKCTCTYGSCGDTVGQRDRLLDRHDPTGGERLAGVIGRGGFDPDHPNPGAQRLQRDGHAGHQAAAADGNKRNVDVGEIGGNLEAHGPLAGDDPIVVERRHHDAPTLGRNVGRDRFTILREPVVLDDAGTICARSIPLHSRRVERHHDRCVDTHDLCRQRHALSVISRRKGHHSPAALVVGELQETVQRTSDLERAAALQVFGLRMDPSADGNVERVTGEQRRAVHMPADALGGGLDVREGDR